ncbi:hypothetical protein MtrunA17_Chr7g0253721 [Medicago truncatula]|uniref:Uncharacterized protein n=2 Tax=Medicago truncatula TaxID=3880 RepID=G7L0H9_MEDTR|nr:hypothetical protein MTR_7g086210 [Medicago truncatula]RHN47504.1 hypothetical protein MtrunA17_Chr7g0253721 [Medicago truncatula]
MDNSVVLEVKMDLEEDSMKVFREGISLAINFWWVIRLKIRRKSLCDYESSPERCVEWLCDTIFSRFIRSKHLPSATIKLQLKFQLISFLSNVPPEDNSILEVCDQLVSMYQECLQHDFSSVQILKEADAHRKRVNKFQIDSLPSIQKKKKTILYLQDCLWQDYLKDLSQSTSFKERFKNSILLSIRLGDIPPSYLETFEEEVTKFGMETYLKKYGMETTPSGDIIQEANVSCSLIQANSSSEIDCSNLTNSIRVFEEGVGLLMEDLWVRHVFIHNKCGSNPSLMLQQLAEDILFWFTQTIKPVSFDYIEWIIRNELYPLPILAKNAFATTQEVAKKLMVMYEECLLDNFSSVVTLREENLSRGSCSTSSNEATDE